jgi:hypothetical protein
MAEFTHRSLDAFAILRSERKSLSIWCRGRDSNPHGGYPPEDFKSSVSAVSPPRHRPLPYASLGQFLILSLFP